MDVSILSKTKENVPQFLDLSSKNVMIATLPKAEFKNIVECVSFYWATIIGFL